MPDNEKSSLSDRCVKSRIRSEALRNRSHRLIIESEVLSCALKLQTRLLEHASVTPINIDERMQTRYKAAIDKLLRYAER